MRKIVLLPIEVPESNYCWGEESICMFFDNEGGHPTCKLNVGDPIDDPKTGWVPKPKTCLDLKEE